MFERRRQRRWDDRGLVTVSTHLTRREYEIVKAVLDMTGQTIYGALQDALREAVARAEASLKSELTNGSHRAGHTSSYTAEKDGVSLR